MLTAWRAEAAAAGNLPILTSLTQAEVTALSKAQAQAVARHVVQLEAHGRLLLRQAAAGQLALQELASDDAAALAWKVHTGGPAAAEDLVGLVLMQVGAGRQPCEHDVAAALPWRHSRVDARTPHPFFPACLPAVPCRQQALLRHTRLSSAPPSQQRMPWQPALSWRR